MQGSMPFFMAAPGAAAPAGLPMILFDFDGTLVDSMRLCVKEIEETCKAMGLPVPPETELKKCNGPSHEEAAELLNIPTPLQAEFCRVRNEYQAALMESCQQIYPGVKEMLHALSNCAQLFIVSNGRQAYIDMSLSRWQIGGYFKKALGGRPNGTKGQLVGELIRESQPVRAMLAGDRLSDFLAGRENGIPTVAAAYGFGTPEEWREADRQAGTVHELMEICLQFCGR